MAKKTGITKSLGMLVLSIFLILFGLVQLVTIPFDISIILALLAIVAGVLILLGR